MLPRFNIAGPCIPGRHYMLPPQRRLEHVLELIEGHSYFTLHAGRQTGKTTSARWLVEHYNAGDRFCAIWVDVQDARELLEPARAFELVLDDLDLGARGRVLTSEAGGRGARGRRPEVSGDAGAVRPGALGARGKRSWRTPAKG